MSGTLVVDGGGETNESIRRFVALAGGPESEFVLIPTARERPLDLKAEEQTFKRRFSVKHVTVLHTRDRAVADTEEFIAPLKKSPRGLARRRQAVAAGRRLHGDAHPARARVRPRPRRGDRRLFGRGDHSGIVPGSRRREGNHIMMAKGYEQGFGYL